MKQQPGEFSLIQRYFYPLSQEDEALLLSNGDDAAVLAIPEQQQLAVSVDTLVAGHHFHPSVTPQALGFKALAVNVSDMMAVAAKPRWFTLALTLPENDAAWLQAFTAGLQQCCQQYDLNCIGGDTTQGPLCLSIQIMGLLTASARSRAAAQVGDQLFVTGRLGAAALAVQHQLQQRTLTAKEYQYCQRALDYPQPPLAFALACAAYIHAAIDISDGLGQDIAHICRASAVGVKIRGEQLPIDDQVLALLGRLPAEQHVLQSGDEYQLCFTASRRHYDTIMQLAEQHQVPLQAIGEVVSASAGMTVSADQQIIELPVQGWQHFR